MMLTPIVVVDTIDTFVMPFKSEVRSGLTYTPYLSRGIVGWVDPDLYTQQCLAVIQKQSRGHGRGTDLYKKSIWSLQ